MSRFFGVASLLAGLAISPVSGQAQSTASPIAYTGPYYPGGPDSLRALVARSTRLALPRPSGRMVLKFELKDGIQPGNFKLVLPPGPPNPSLLKAALAATEYLQAHMPAWQAGISNPDLKTATDPKIRLLLDYDATSIAQPYAYADQEPSFPNEAALKKIQKKGRPIVLNYSPKSLIAYTQREVKYPSAALRLGQQGVGYVYFEIAENGAIERPAILGSVGENLDEEILRAVGTIPAATSPALVRGRPARVYYVLPITFIIN